jgi:NADH:ubiquinone oxidoreductase subunit 2 (subunit N)
MVLLAAAGALNSAISVFYYFRIGRAMFLEEVSPLPDGRPAENVSRTVTAVLAVCAVLLLVLGLLPSLLASRAAAALIGQ